MSCIARPWPLPLLLALLMLPPQLAGVDSALSTVTATTASASTAAPALPPGAAAIEFIDPGALASAQRWVLALDIRVLTSGRLGEWVARLTQDEHLQAQLAVTSATIGIDLLHDLDLLAVSGPDARWTEAVLAASGRFPRPRLETLVHAANGGAIVSAPPERLMVVPRGCGAEDLFACLRVGERRLLVATRRQRLVQALAAENGASGACRTPASFPAALAAVPGEAPLLWLAAAGFKDWAGLPPQAAPLARITGIQVLVVVAGDQLRLRLAGVAVDSATGARLASIIDGGLSLVALDRRVRSDAALAALVDSAELHRRGARVELTASLPIALAERCWTTPLLQAHPDEPALSEMPAQP